MAMLNFKHGKYENLFKKDGQGQLQVPISNGTIYVTTDEKAMYVDLNNERIRLSQMITLDTIKEWEGLQPPYSTEAFYYISQANALLKYTGTEWVQLNSTKDLDDRLTEVEKYGALISGLDNRVDKAESDIETHATAIVGLRGDRDELKRLTGYVGAFAVAPSEHAENDIYFNTADAKFYIYRAASGWSEYGNLPTEIENLRVLVSSAPTDANFKALQETVGALNTLVQGIDTDVSTLKDDVSGLKTWKEEMVGTTLPGMVNATKAAQDKADAVETTINDATNGLKAAHEKAGAAQTTANEAEANAQQALKDAKAANDNAETRVKIEDFEEFKTENTNAIADAKKAGTDAQTAAEAAAEAASAAQQAADAAQAAIDDKDTGLGAAHTKAANAQQAADNAQKAADDAQGEIDALEVVVGDANSGLVKKANDNAEAINGLNQSLDAEIADREEAIADLKSEIENKLQAADAMKFAGTVAEFNDLPVPSDVEGAEVVVEKGATYKATEAFTMVGENDDVILVHIGDLLIANGEEDADGKLTTVKWEHVPSGYVADYNPEMSVSEDAGTVFIKLTSGHAKDGDGNAANDVGDLGAFAFEADADSALTVSVDVNNKITMGMSWGSF